MIHTLTESGLLIIQSSVWFIDDWVKSGSYPTLENFADYIYVEMDAAGLSITKDELEYCAGLINQRYTDFASADDISAALESRLADKISTTSGISIFAILGITLFIGYLIRKVI